MAKKDRDGNRSRETQGGIRRSEAIRHVERAIAPSYRPVNRAVDFELDLSAFSVDPLAERFERQFDEIARAQDTRQPGRMVSMQNRKREDSPSKRAAERRAEAYTPLEAKLGPAVRPALKVSLGQKQSMGARRDHLHVSSAPPRKESPRQNCKERPTETKGGKGASRAFVPWCTRKS